MNTAAELLNELRGQGFTLAADGDRIRVTPATRLTAELRDRLRRHKADLLAAFAPAARFIVNTRGEALDAADASDGPPGPLDVAALQGDALDAPADPTQLQARVDALTEDPTWASRWAERLKA